MGDGDNHDHVAPESIKHTLRKAPELTAPYLFVELLAALRESADSLDGGLEFIAEVLTEPRLLLLKITGRG